MALEVDELRQILFDKSKEILRLYARNGDLRAEVDDLMGKLGSTDEEVTQLRQKSSNLEEEMAKLEEEMSKLREELVCKDEIFLQTKDELTRDATESYTAGFEDDMAQVAYVHPGWIFPKLG